MVINHNLGAMNAQRMMTNNTSAASKAMEKLSSGLKINRAGDDAAGLAISEKMRNQIKGLDQASDNGENAISMIQTAEGALSETHSILQRMGQLATQASNSTSKDSDRGQIQKEMDELSKEITRIANDTEFNQQTLLNGGISSNGLGNATFQIGANSGQQIDLSINAMDAKSLGVSRDVKTSTDATLESDIGAVSASTDETEVSKTLADASYTVTVASKAAGAVNVAKSSNVSIGSGSSAAVTGTATDDVNFTLKYDGTNSKWKVDGTDPGVTITTAPAVASTISAIQVGSSASDTLAFDSGSGTTLDGYKFKIDTTPNSSGPATAGVDASDTSGKTILIKFSSTAANNTADKIQAAIRSGAGSAFANVLVTGAGTMAAGAAGASAPTSAAIATSAFAGGSAGGTTFSYKGVTVDASKLSGQSANDTVTITASKKATVTAQLSDSLGATIGSAVTIDQAAGGTYKLGNTSTGQMAVKFDAGKAKAGNSTVVVGTSAAGVATLQNNNTMSKATTSGGLNVSTVTAASSAITVIQNAVEKVSTERAKLGAYQNRLEHTVANLGTSSENLTSAESRIRDVDMAKEMMEFSKNNVLTQAAQAMIAQAKQQPEQVLSLLR